MEFILPSGVRVEFHEPNWGEMLDALDAHDKGAKIFANAKCAAIVTSHTIAEIAKLTKDDGLVLMMEVNRIFQGRPAEADLPLDNGSQPSPTGSSRKK
jgi:hypothetical protein